MRHQPRTHRCPESSARTLLCSPSGLRSQRRRPVRRIPDRRQESVRYSAESVRECSCTTSVLRESSECFFRKFRGASIPFSYKPRLREPAKPNVISSCALPLPGLCSLRGEGNLSLSFFDP